jgi:hypothetical protein
MAVRRSAASVPLLLLLGLTSGAQAVGVYQWKDAKGVTHYADAPPPSGRYDARELHAPAASTGPAPAAAIPTRPAADAQAAVAAVEPAPAATTPPQPANAANCTTARANLGILKTDGPIGVDANGDGKPDAVLSDSERASQATLAESNIATFCNPSQPSP